MNFLKPRFAIGDFILEIMQVPASQLQLAQLQDWVAKLNLSELVAVQPALEEFTK